MIVSHRADLAPNPAIKHAIAAATDGRPASSVNKHRPGLQALSMGRLPGRNRGRLVTRKAIDGSAIQILRLIEEPHACILKHRRSFRQPTAEFLRNL
jgi:hypothetical protein